jgi:RNA 2',3'-cyclic 3'-phosphodiesterase
MPPARGPGARPPGPLWYPCLVRLFVAITPSAAALDELDAAIAPLRAAWPGLHWTSPQSWHVTLAFLGEVEEPATSRLAARLERAAGRRRAALDLYIGGGGAFPSVVRGRVLWAGIRGNRQELRDIAGAVIRGAARAGAPSPDGGRRYRPHITLARCREQVDLRPLVDALARHSGPSWPADRIHLIRSHQSGHPGEQNRYESIGSWPFDARGADPAASR